MRRILLRLRWTFALWRLEGYDGTPNSLRLAWDIAGALGRSR